MQQYFTILLFYCIFDQINAALPKIHCFQKHKKTIFCRVCDHVIIHLVTYVLFLDFFDLVI